jgi:cobalt/nickel transport system permease protein
LSNINRLDPFRPGYSPVYLLDARVKLLLSLSLIITINLVKPGLWIIYATLAFIIFSIIIISKIQWKSIFMQSLLALPFILAALPLLFTIPGEPFISKQLSGINITVSLEGLSRFLSIFIKSWLSIIVSIILVRTTQFSEILFGLRWLHMPRLLVVIIGLMWRYLFVFSEEAKRLINARDSRSSKIIGRKGGGDLMWRSKISGSMAGSLFLRSIDRSERVFNAMVSRGFDNEIRLLKQENLRNNEIYFLITCLFLLLLILILSLLLTG